MNRKSKIILCLLLCFGAYLSLFKLTESPPVWYDEGIYNQIAISQAVYGQQGIQVAPETLVSSGFVTGGFPFIFPIAFSLDLFGIGIFQARIVMFIFIVGLFGVIFYLSKLLFGYKKALVSLLLIVTFPIIYGNGKNVLGEIPGLFYLFSFLVCVHAIVKYEYKNVIPYLLAGLFGGLCLATKPIFFLLGGAVIVAAIVHRKSITFNWKYLSFGFIAFLVPIAIWFNLQFLSSDNTASILGYYANPYGLDNITHVIWNNFTRFFKESSPIYFAFFMLVWITSYVYRWRKGVATTLAESIAFFFSILVSVAYLRTAGWYRYFFVAEVLAIVFFINNIYVIYEIDLLKRYKHLLKYAVIGLVVIISLVQSYQLFFTSWVASHYHSNVSYDLHNALKDFDSDTIFYIYDVPEVTIFLPNQKFYQYLQPTPSLDFGREQLEVIDQGIPDALIVNTRRLNDNPEILSKYVAYKTVNSYNILKRK